MGSELLIFEMIMVLNHDGEYWQTWLLLFPMDIST